MCGLRKAGLALLLALPTTEVLAESLVSCAAGSCPGQPSTQAPSMVQTKMQRRLALVGGAGDLAGAVTRLAVSGRDGKDLELQLQEASALVSAFKSLAAAGNGTNGTLKGVDKTQLAAIKDLINKTFFANLQNLSAEDQAEVTSDHAFLVQCGTPLQSSLSNDVANALAKLNASRTSHKHCRTAEAAAFMANTTAWSQYSALVQNIPPPPACPTYTQTLDAMEDYFDSAQNTQKKWYEDNAPVFAAKKTTYNNADQTLQSERTRCNGLQSTVEQDYCFYQVRLQTTCSTYETCHQTNLGKYTATTARVRQSEATRKSLFKSGTAIICHLDVILTASKVHDDCTSEVSGVDTSSLDISYPAAPSKSICDTTTVSAFPCDAGWIAAEYSWMPQGAAAAACSKCPSQTPAPTPAPTPQPTPQPTPAPTPQPTPQPTPAPSVLPYIETPMKRSTTERCTAGLTVYQDLWQCLNPHESRAQVAKGACSNEAGCVAVYTRPGTNDYVMVFGSKGELDSAQCTYKDQGVGAPTWNQDPNGEDATCFTKA